jgi:hypothetical protein
MWKDKGACIPPHLVAKEGPKKGASGTANMCKLNEVSCCPTYYASFSIVNLPLKSFSGSRSIWKVRDNFLQVYLPVPIAKQGSQNWASVSATRSAQPLNQCFCMTILQSNMYSALCLCKVSQPRAPSYCVHANVVVFN